jgi:transcriptional regulator with XRE-family HTH domain
MPTMSQMDRSRDALRRELLAAFLRSRRARLDPESVGIGVTARRRVPGLRREEVAQLADVGITWSTWLEQGRAVHPSAQVIAAIADALRLNEHERRHLFTLAETSDPTSPADPGTANLGAIVDGFADAPAYVVNARWDVLARNDCATALLGDLGPIDGRPRNIMEVAFTTPSWRELVIDWDAEAARHVAMYRAAMALHLDDPTWTTLPERLCESVPEFRAIWDRHDVAGPERRTKRYRHPAVGEMTFESTALVIADAPALRLMLLRPIDEGSVSRLARLRASFA